MTTERDALALSAPGERGDAPPPTAAKPTRVTVWKSKDRETLRIGTYQVVEWPDANPVVRSGDSLIHLLPDLFSWSPIADSAPVSTPPALAALREAALKVVDRIDLAVDDATGCGFSGKNREIVADALCDFARALLASAAGRGE